MMNIENFPFFCISLHLWHLYDYIFVLKNLKIFIIFLFLQKLKRSLSVKMTLSDLSEADGNQDDSSNLFRILISSDIHLGYAEKDPERGVDSFNSFDELLGIGVKEEVDMVLLGGDLFHENKPSRQAEIKCVQILRNHVLGELNSQVFLLVLTSSYF